MVGRGGIIMAQINFFKTLIYIQGRKHTRTCNVCNKELFISHTCSYVYDY